MKKIKIKNPSTLHPSFKRIRTADIISQFDTRDHLYK